MSAIAAPISLIEIGRSRQRRRSHHQLAGGNRHEFDDLADLVLKLVRQEHAPGLPHSGLHHREIMLMLDDLRVLIQPGALVSIVVILLMIAAGDAAIIIATKGWPF